MLIIFSSILQQTHYGVQRASYEVLRTNIPMRNLSYLILGTAIFVVLGAGCATSPSSTAENTDVTFVDMHAHIQPTTEEENATYIDDIVATARANGVSQIVLGLHARHEPERPPTFSTEHDDWVLDAAKKYPGFIIPSLGGFDPADPDAVDYVREHLATGDWKMIGELDLRNRVKKTTTAANTSIMMDIYEIAAEYDVPVMMHYDFEYGASQEQGLAEFADALEKNPDTTFIYAHSCGTQIVTFMKTYDNLYCEQSFTPIARGIDMNRVVLGTDIQVHGNNPDAASDDYESLIMKLDSAISGWDDADVTRAASTTPKALLNL